MSINQVPRLLNARSRQLGTGLLRSPDLPFWIAASTGVVLSAILGFFLHGGMHGLYVDDYTEKAWAFDFMSAKWKLNLIPQFHIRSLAHIFSANTLNAIPEHELPARLLIVAIHCLNVFLIGSLAYKLTRSLVVGINASAFFLFPIFANEALLWFDTAVANTISLALLLIGFHCLLSCRSPKEDLRLFCCGVGAWILMVLFYESGLFTLLLLPAFFGLSQEHSIRRDVKIWISALLASFIPIGIYLAMVVRTDPDVISRGGTTLNWEFILTQRVPAVAGRIWWLLSDWGVRGPLKEAFRLGWHEWMALPYGRLLITSLLIGVCLTAMLLPRCHGFTPSTSHLLKLVAISCGWIGLGFVPIILVKSQIVEVRTLYVPSVGLALCAAAVSGLLVRLLGRWQHTAARAVLVVAGLWVVVGALTMAGLVRTYELRWDLDQRQVAAMQRFLSETSPSEFLWLMPVGLDEQSVGTYWGRNTTLDRYLFGVFETPWSARDGIYLKYGSRKVQVLASNRWVPLRVNSLWRYDSREIISLTVQGHEIPVSEFVPFTYQHSRVILLNPLEIGSSVVNLPLVKQLSAKGLPTQPAHLESDQ